MYYDITYLTNWTMWKTIPSPICIQGRDLRIYAFWTLTFVSFAVVVAKTRVLLSTTVVLETFVVVVVVVEPV